MRETTTKERNDILSILVVAGVVAAIVVVAPRRGIRLQRDTDGLV